MPVRGPARLPPESVNRRGIPVFSGRYYELDNVVPGNYSTAMLNGHTTILNLLEGLDFFAGFDKDEMNQLLEAGEWSRATNEEYIISEGDLDLYMYVLVQGKVEVILHDKILATLETGDTFGEFGLMGGRRTAHVLAKGDCLLVGFNADRLNLLPLPLQIKFLKKILFTLFARLQKVNRRTWWDLPTQWR